MKKLLLLLAIPIVFLVAQSGYQLVDLNHADILGVVIPNVTPPTLPTGVGVHTINVRFDGIVLATDHAVGFESPTPTALCPMVGVRVSADNQIQADFLSASSAACTPATGTYKILILRTRP